MSAFLEKKGDFKFGATHLKNWTEATKGCES